MAAPVETPDPAARRKRRSLVLALVLGAVVVLFYVLTVVKMAPALFDRAL